MAFITVTQHWQHASVEELVRISHLDKKKSTQIFIQTKRSKIASEGMCCSWRGLDTRFWVKCWILIIKKQVAEQNTVTVTIRAKKGGPKHTRRQAGITTDEVDLGPSGKQNSRNTNRWVNKRLDANTNLTNKGMRCRWRNTRKQGGGADGGDAAQVWRETQARDAMKS